MRKLGVVLFSAALAVGMLFFGSYGGFADTVRKAKAQTLARPNIIFILTDDMRYDDLKYMRQTRSLLGNRGMSFENAFVSTALCAPSRATIMRGQYSHNTGVLSNSSIDSSSTDVGGWLAYRQNRNEADNVATRLHGAGYRTGLFGKYMNGYGGSRTVIPRGWDRWFATQRNFFDYNVNNQGTTIHFGTSKSDYMTDVLSRETNAFIENSASRGQPFFAYVAPNAPHLPATPAPRDAHAYDGARAPRLPSFNEANVSDKPPWISERPGLTPDQLAAINTRHENRVESLQAVDDLVQGVVDTLRAAGELRNTYIFFTSDNGLHHGEHLIPGGKWRPYEEDMHVPLLVRGPGVAAGSTTRKMALDTDYLPTFTDLAGTRTPSYVDGRTLGPVLDGSVTPWRSAILLEGAAHYSPAYRGIRTLSTSTTTKRKYIEYAGGERELYYLLRDPYELTNSFDAARPPTFLSSRLDALRTCAAGARDPRVTCQVAEDGR